MTINLEEYINKQVEIKQRNGTIRVGKLFKMQTNHEVCAPGSFFYFLTPIPHGGSYNYNTWGRCFSDKEEPYDIVKIKEIKSIVTRSKIDVFTIDDERVEVTVDENGIFLTSCSKGTREDFSIGSRDLAIDIARCILENYNEAQK